MESRSSNTFNSSKKHFSSKSQFSSGNSVEKFNNSESYKSNNIKENQSEKSSEYDIKLSFSKNKQPEDLDTIIERVENSDKKGKKRIKFPIFPLNSAEKEQKMNQSPSLMKINNLPLPVQITPFLNPNRLENRLKEKMIIMSSVGENINLQIT